MMPRAFTASGGAVYGAARVGAVGVRWRYPISLWSLARCAGVGVTLPLRCTAFNVDVRSPYCLRCVPVLFLLTLCNRV